MQLNRLDYSPKLIRSVRTRFQRARKPPLRFRSGDFDVEAYAVYQETLKWDGPYSPDIASSDYHLFRSMTHGLADQHFRSYEETKNWVDSWIKSKDESFYRHDIRMLPEKWEKLVASNGQYSIDQSVETCSQ